MLGVVTKLRVLDLYCGGGGAAVGIRQAIAGVRITGIDINRQADYPFKLFQANICLLFNKPQLWKWFSGKFDFIWASPPCQAYSRAAQSWMGNQELPALIPETRELLQKSGKPYCIENVESAPLETTSIRLCGEMFGLGVIRHRLFETNWPCPEPIHVPHRRAEFVPGRKHKQSPYCSVAGNGGDSWSYKLSDWQQAMGIDWITDRKTLVEAVPPAYSCYILSQFLSWRRSDDERLRDYPR